MSSQLVHIGWAIKHYAQRKDFFPVFEGFISALLAEKLHIVSVIDSVSVFKEAQAGDTTSRIAFRCQNAWDETIVIELQAKQEIDYPQKIFWDAHHSYEMFMKENPNTRKMHKVVGICITFCSVGTDYIYHGKTKFNSANIEKAESKEDKAFPKKHQLLMYHDYFFPQGYIIVPHNFTGKVRTVLDEWVYMFQNSQFREGASGEAIETAQKLLDYGRLTEAEKQQHDELIEKWRTLG